MRHSPCFESKGYPNRTIVGSKAPPTIAARGCHQWLRAGPMRSLEYTCGSVAESVLQEV